MLIRNKFPPLKDNETEVSSASASSKRTLQTSALFSLHGGNLFLINMFGKNISASLSWTDQTTLSFRPLTSNERVPKYVSAL